MIVTLLILTFVGQSVAAVRMSCSDQSSQPQQTGAVMMDHSQHMASMVDTNEEPTQYSAEHCNDCVCGPGGCSTALLPAYQPSFDSSLSLSVSLLADITVSQLATSLYRPPIFR